MHGDDQECHYVPTFEHQGLEGQVRAFATREDAPGITHLCDCRFHERREVPTARELGLYPCAPRLAEHLRPLSIDLALEIERVLLVGDIAWGNEQTEGYPHKEGVNGEEGAVVEEDAGPPDKGCEDAEARCNSGEDELRAVAYAYNVGVLPDIEPGEEAEDKCDDRVGR